MRRSQSIKVLIPHGLRVVLRTLYNRVWLSRNYDSFPYGLWWSLWNRVYKTEGMRFQLPFQMMPIGFRSRFLFDAYEKGERTLTKKYLDTKDVIFELGGCLGIVSCISNRLLSEPTRHVVVEANPELIPWIAKNKMINNAKFNIEQGLLSRSSNGDFHIHKLIVSGSADLEGGRLVKVPVFPIEKLCEKYSFTPTVLVMDIEGGEISFLNENFEWLKQQATVSKLIVEVHPFIVGQHAIDRFHDQLEELGFSKKDNIGTVEAWIREP